MWEAALEFSTGSRKLYNAGAGGRIYTGPLTSHAVQQISSHANSSAVSIEWRGASGRPDIPTNNWVRLPSSRQIHSAGAPMRQWESGGELPRRGFARFLESRVSLDVLK